MHLNYHHLQYFWVTATRGSLTRAAREMHVSPSTVSAQIRALEDQLGEPLFVRLGRRLELTEAGRLVLGYADEIFALGKEVTEAVQRRESRARRVAVGLSDVVPKLIAFKLLEPALADPALRMMVNEDRPEALVSALAIHTLDVVINDAPLPPGMSVRAFSHLLGGCDVMIFAPAASAGRYKKGFPGSLHDAPFLLPMSPSTLRRSLDLFFDDHGIRPRTRAEIHDSALLKVFAQGGAGLFAGPAAIHEEIERQFHVRALGTLPGIREHYYAITVERRVKHPAVHAIVDAAREDLFSA